MVELAVTNAEREKGLGYRQSLPANTGMLFLFDHKDILTFWMKGMNFPLDYIWIDGNEIVDVSQDVPIYTNNQLTVIKPKNPADKVLEVPVGTIKSLHIKIGDRVTYKN